MNIIGIYLGTTFSAAAHIDEHGHPVIIRNRDGENIMPSVVSFESEHQVRVGEEARKALGQDPNTFGRFKRHMGESKVYEAHGQTHTPTSLSSLVLKKLKDEAEAQIGPIDEVVVTIPANFGNEAREATMEAAKMAGLDIRHIINEPNAAALFYAHQSSEKLNGVYAVYDLGGGTFDVSIVRLSGQEVELLATEGVQKIGGDDFDEAVLTIARNKYEAETNGTLEQGDFTRNDAEAHKISLSSRPELNFRVHSEGGRAILNISRVEFEEAISPFIAQTEMLCETAMDKAEVAPENIKGVFLVGGSTRVPAFYESVKKVFKQEPTRTSNVDEVVALGAALYALYKADPSTLTPVQKSTADPLSVQEIASNCYGIIELVRDEEHGENKPVNTILIEYGEKIPCSVTRTYYTSYDGQENFRFTVTQSKRPVTDPEFAKVIWSGDLELPPGRPAGQEIVVTFGYDESHTMHCSFVDKATGKETKLVLSMTSASENSEQKIDKFMVE